MGRRREAGVLSKGWHEWRGGLEAARDLLSGQAAEQENRERWVSSVGVFFG